MPKIHRGRTCRDVVLQPCRDCPQQVASSVRRNNGNDFYVATVDDYIHAFLHVVNYYQYLKGDMGGLH